MLEKKLNFSIIGATGATADFYIPVPVKCIVKSMQAAASADPGDNETITLLDGSNTVGTLTYGASIAAGALGTYAKDATYGNTVFDAGDVIKLTVSQLAAAATFVGYIIIDEFALTVQ